MSCVGGSVDVIPVVDRTPSVQIPTLLSNIGTTEQNPDKAVPTRHLREKKKAHKDNGVGSNLLHTHSNDCLHELSSDRSGIGSNTESQEDLLDTRAKNRRNRQGSETTDLVLDAHAKNLRNRHASESSSNSPSTKVADLIGNFEETARLSQGSGSNRTDGFKMMSPVEVEVGGCANGESVEVGKERVGRVVSTETPQSYAKPETLVLEVGTQYLLYKESLL